MAHGHGHGHDEGGGNKTIAIIISILALFLAIAETAGKGAQTDAIKYNIETANLWAFFQAKTIRRTNVEVAAETMELDIELARDPAIKAKLEKRVTEWKQTAARYRSEPKKGPGGVEMGEGSVELSKRALQAEEKHKTSLAKYHHYEIASAAFQIAIVLASASIITGVAYMLWAAGALGAVGILFMCIGMFFPHAVHIF